MADSSATSSFEQEKQWSCTEVKVSKYTFTWTIKNLTFLENKEILKSPTFHVGGKSESKWHLNLYPKGNEEKYKEFCSLYLRLDSCLSSEIEVKLKLSMLKNKTLLRECGGFDLNVFKPNSGYGFPEFIRRDFLFDETKGLVPGDKLRIICEVHVFDEIVNIPGVSHVTVPKCQLSEDLQILFENENLSDVKLTADDSEYRVHKAILAARSKVFAGMFTHDMEENRSNQVNIPDIDGDVCKEMLHFIYTGKAPNLDKVAEGLLAAAEKYELNKLKAMCEEELALKLSVGNAAATLILADLHSADQLKAQTLNFIAIHTFDVVQTEGWKNMSSAHLPLVMETFLAIEKSKTCQSNK